MKKNLRYIGYLLIFIIFNNFFISCNDDDMLENIQTDDSIVENILDNACTVWCASRNDVKEQMNGYVLIDSDADFLQYTDQSRKIRLSYDFINDSLRATVAIAPKLTNNPLLSYLKEYKSLGELSSKEVYYNTSKNTMCFSYDALLNDTEYSIIGFSPIISNLYDGDIIIKVDYKNLYYTIDGKQFKMILVDGGTLPAFYMMQTELPISSEFKIGETYIGKIDSNGDNCITKLEFRNFRNKINDETGLVFRLPTEEEWKFAAKGGVNSNNYTYSGSNDINDVAWYNGNSNEIQDVALKKSNELGFYDMSGNYAEVCSSDPINVDGRTYGGCWKYVASKCTSSSYQSGNSSSTTKIPGTSIYEINSFDGRYITVRLVYSAPE